MGHIDDNLDVNIDSRDNRIDEDIDKRIENYLDSNLDERIEVTVKRYLDKHIDRNIDTNPDQRIDNSIDKSIDKDLTTLDKETAVTESVGEGEVIEPLADGEGISFKDRSEAGISHPMEKWKKYPKRRQRKLPSLSGIL